MTKGLVAVQAVSYRYGTRKVRVLHDLSLEVEEGSATAVLGPNGVGKTTLLHLVLGWLKPESGTIELDGKPLSHSCSVKNCIKVFNPSSIHVH